MSKIHIFFTNHKKSFCVIAATLLLCLTCVIVIYMKSRYTPYNPSMEPQFLLYGEEHGKKETLEKEYQLWKECYDTKNMRYLFIEKPYYTAKYLNLWMKAERDDILEDLYDDIDGCKSHIPELKTFYINIKQNCPETIFIGTDVGHQFFSTGERYLNYLKSNGQYDSLDYKLTLDNMEQGKKYRETNDQVYRENAITQNFITAYNGLNGEKIMGIYGDAHSDPRKKNFFREVDCMAKQLKSYYGDVIMYRSLCHEK